MILITLVYFNVSMLVMRFYTFTLLRINQVRKIKILVIQRSGTLRDPHPYPSSNFERN